MKTDDLIRALAADGERAGTPFSNAIIIAFSSAATVIVFAIWIGPRADFVAALSTTRFPFKVLVVAALAVAAAGLMLRIGRPGANLMPWLLSAIVVAALLVAGAAVELYVLPASAWFANWNGTHRAVCLVVIPTLSVVPLIATIFRLRHEAPSNPTLAGAVAGLASGAFAATLYALNCDNDSPLFVVTWYPLAIGIVVGAGMISGSKFLRW